MNPDQVIDIFKRSGTLSEVTAEELLTEARNTGRAIDEIMEEQGIADSLSFARIMASELGVDAMDLSTFEPTPGLIHLIPAGMARLHEAIPLWASGNQLTIALANSLDIQALEDIRFTLNREIVQVVAPRKQVEELIKRHYGLSLIHI